MFVEVVFYSVVSVPWWVVPYDEQFWIPAVQVSEEIVYVFPVDFVVEAVVFLFAVDYSECVEPFS